LQQKLLLSTSMCWDGVGEIFGAYFRVNIANLRPQQRLLHVAPILLTHSMQQSPFWEANRFAASQELARIL
jgi:hypothetical protein